MLFKTQQQLFNIEKINLTFLIGVQIFFSFVLLLVNNTDNEFMNLVTPWIWDLYLLGFSASLSLMLYNRIEFEQLQNKLLSLILLLLCCYNLVDYLTMSLFVHFQNIPEILYNFIYGLSSFIFIIFGLHTSSNVLKENRSSLAVPYSNKGSFIAYRKPKYFFDGLAALFYSPYGSCGLVIDGQHFGFHGKKNISEQTLDTFKRKTYFFHKTKKPVSLTEARQLIGKPWRLWRNCFLMFNKY